MTSYWQDVANRAKNEVNKFNTAWYESLLTRNGELEVITCMMGDERNLDVLDISAGYGEDVNIVTEQVLRTSQLTSTIPADASKASLSPTRCGNWSTKAAAIPPPYSQT